MLTRREFIHTAAASTAGIAIAGSDFGMASAAPTPSILSHVVFDERLGLSQSFGAASRATALATESFSGDISPLWRTVLQKAWKEQPQPIAGLTGHGPLFVLERMGWKYDMRATFRAQHASNADGFLEHQLQGPADLVEMLEIELPKAGAHFAEVMAKAVASHPTGTVPQKQITLTTNIRVDMQEPLYSFVLAPRAQCCTLKPYSHNHSA